MQLFMLCVFEKQGNKTIDKTLTNFTFVAKKKNIIMYTIKKLYKQFTIMVFLLNLFVFKQKIIPINFFNCTFQGLGKSK